METGKHLARRASRPSLEVMKEKILELLGLNIPNNIVAQAVGVSDSYVSQLMSDEAFAVQVQTLRLRNLSESATRDGKWNGLEDKLLEKLEQLLPMSFTKPAELLRALQVVNAAKRRASATEGLGLHTPSSVVPLVLPMIFAPKLQINTQGQVIEVDGRSIATMPASVVNKQLTDDRKERQEVQKQIREDAERAVATIERLDSLGTFPARPLHEVI